MTVLFLPMWDRLFNLFHPQQLAALEDAHLATDTGALRLIV